MIVKSLTENVLGRVDWLQVIFQNIAWQDVFTQILQISLDCVSYDQASLKHEEYDTVYSCGSIKYFTFFDPKFSVQRGTLVMSGQACAMYEWAILANDTEMNVFQMLSWRIIQYAKRTTLIYEVKRLDLALDDYNEKPFFDLDLIIGKVRRKQFLSKGRSTKVIDSEFDKRTRAKTQQIGTRGSECLFRFYEKAKELARSFDGEQREMILNKAPQVRLEIELRKSNANNLFEAIGFLGKDQAIANLIRGFIKTELNFYSDTNYKNICRWWIEYLKPCLIPNLERRIEVTNFEKTLSWYEYQGGFAVSQALYFLVNNGIDIKSELIGKQENYYWSTDLANKLIDFVTKHQRLDLIPLITEKTKESPTSAKIDDSQRK